MSLRETNPPHGGIADRNSYEMGSFLAMIQLPILQFSFQYVPYISRHNFCPGGGRVNAICLV